MLLTNEYLFAWGEPAKLKADTGEGPQGVATRLWAPVPSALGGRRPKAEVCDGELISSLRTFVMRKMRF